jgi:hypothetical protein
MQTVTCPAMKISNKQVSARKVPNGLRMFFLPEEPQEDMVTSPVPTSATPGKAHKEKK